jgi:uncharacterized protein (TIGR00255 family)
MLLSMTGHGESTISQPPAHVAVELRSVNSRHFKVSLRLPDGCGSWQSSLEASIREAVPRGHVSLQVTLTVKDDKAALIDQDLLRRYHTQLTDALAEGTPPITELLPALLSLPGVVSQSQGTADNSEHLPLVQQALQAGLENLTAMRSREGAAMASNLLENLDQIASVLERVAERVPTVVDEYRARLHARITQLLEPHGVELSPTDLIKEVGIFADRADISEELVRLQSHVEQFRGEVNSQLGSGRALDFLAQEMGREANTVGAKANDATIAAQVIELKTCIERIRELVQNVQ